MERMLPVHPGEMLLEEFLRPMGISQTQLSLATGMPQSRIQAIVSGKRGLTTDTAIRLAAFFGNSAEFWLNCQSSYELDRAEYTGEKERIIERVHPYCPGSLKVESGNFVSTTQ